MSRYTRSGYPGRSLHNVSLPRRRADSSRRPSGNPALSSTTSLQNDARDATRATNFPAPGSVDTTGLPPVLRRQLPSHGAMMSSPRTVSSPGPAPSAGSSGCVSRPPKLVLLCECMLGPPALRCADVVPPLTWAVIPRPARWRGSRPTSGNAALSVPTSRASPLLNDGANISAPRCRRPGSCAAPSQVRGVQVEALAQRRTDLVLVRLCRRV